MIGWTDMGHIIWRLTLHSVENKQVLESIFRDPNGKKIGEYGGKVNLKEFNLWIPKKK